MNWGKRVKLSVMSALVLMAMFVLITGAEASFWVKKQGFYYSPSYGALGATLKEIVRVNQIKKELEAGFGTASSAGYDFEGNWGIRLDTFSFTGVSDYHTRRTEVLIKTSVSPTILSLVYHMPDLRFNSYVGAGIGVFFSELTAFSTTTYRNHPGHLAEDYQRDSPVGFQILAGIEGRLKDGLFFTGEIRYLSAKSIYTGFQSIPDCSTDWSGLFISVGVGYLFD